MMRILFLITTLSSLSMQVLAQESNHKNAIYVSCCGLVTYHSQYSFAYERELIQKNKFAIAAKISLGNYNEENKDNGGNFLNYFTSVACVLMYGVLELDLGITIPIYESSQRVYVGTYNGPIRPHASRPAILPDIDLALRMPVKSFFFRIGVGYPELGFVGGGFAF